jgi:hypothetical protein
LSGTAAEVFGLVGLDIFQAVENAPVQLEINRADALRPPSLEGGFADAPAFSQLTLVEMFDAHVSLPGVG